MNENAQSLTMKTGKAKMLWHARRYFTSQGRGDVETQGEGGGLLESARRKRLSMSERERLFDKQERLSAK